MELFLALVVIGGLGMVFGVLLAFAANYFAVEEDSSVEIIYDLLPGANCGACGFPGCFSYAENIVRGSVDITSCIPGGREVSESISEIMDMNYVDSKMKKVAKIYCLGSRNVASDKFEYHGVKDCKAAEAFSGGFKACQYGCLRLGTCVKRCPFDALQMGSNGLPVVDLRRCTGCAVCVKACPRHLIQVVDAERTGKYVPCNSKARGKLVRKVCEVGCTGCKACIKACPRDAIVVEENLAVIHGSRCDNCGKCINVCRRRIIKDLVNEASNPSVQTCSSPGDVCM